MDVNNRTLTARGPQDMSDVHDQLLVLLTTIARTRATRRRPARAIRDALDGTTNARTVPEGPFRLARTRRGRVC